MTTFEEDLVDIYFNLKNYFTIKNIPYPSTEKRKGGKGRGEIDILAAHIKDGEFKSCLHIEVSVSVTSKFPHKDTPATIVKKFFGDSEHHIKKIIGNTSHSCMMITSDFDKNAKEKLKTGLSSFGMGVSSLASTGTGNSLILEVKYQGVVKIITIQPFSHIYFNLLKDFQKKDLLSKSFQDPRLRAIQHSLIIMSKRDKAIELWKESKQDLIADNS